MSLIKCPDCGKEVSENAKTCMYCGAPIKRDAKDNKVFIKLPRFRTAKNSTSFKTSNNKCSVKKGNDVLWSGYADETAKFDIETETCVDIYVEGVKDPKYAKFGFLFCIPALAFIIGGFFCLFANAIAFGLILMLLGIGCVFGELYMLLHLYYKKLKTVKIISQKVEPGLKYEVVDVENANSIFFDLAKVKYKLREIDVIDSRD